MKKFNKIVSAALVGTMALGLVGCASADGSGNAAVNETPAATETPASTETPAAETTTTTTSEPAAEVAAEVVKPESIKVMWDGTIFKEGDNYAEVFYDALEQALGMDIEFIRPDHSTYAEQVGIAFTNKETLADVVILPSNYYAAYAAQGNLWNMTDAWLNSETYNSGRGTDVAETIVNQWYVAGPDGTKGIYGMYPARGNGCITYVKADVAEAAGYTAENLPKNWAEYQEFLLAMKDVTGAAPVLAAGLITHEAPYTNYLPEFYQDAYPEFYYDEASGQWVDGFSEQSMIDALARLNWAYENGVLDSQILENPSTSDVRNKFYTGGTTSVFTYWAGTWAYNNKNNLKKNDQPDELLYLEPIAELGSYIERLSPMICITSACENPEGVFKYFIDPMNDGGDVQMLWMYGVEGTHYVWNEDGVTITGCVTEASKGSEKESKTTKNLFESNLKLYNFAGVDPYVPADECINESFELFNRTSTAAPAINSSEEYNDNSAALWKIKDELIAKAVKGDITPEQAIATYNEEAGAIVSVILDSFNN